GREVPFSHVPPRLLDRPTSRAGVSQLAPSSIAGLPGRGAAGFWILWPLDLLSPIFSHHARPRRRRQLEELVTQEELGIDPGRSPGSADGICRPAGPPSPGQVLSPDALWQERAREEIPGRRGGASSMRRPAALVVQGQGVELPSRLE